VLEQISEPTGIGSRAQAGRHVVLLDLGMRPFYLLAAIWAALSVLAWGFGMAGWLPIPVAMTWHGHEMIFGFTAAVIVGFLLTAARNWTGRDTASGLRLGLLCALWIVARLSAVTGPGWLAAAANGLFFLASALELARVLVPEKKPKNLLFPAVLLVLGMASVTWNLDPARSHAMARVGLGAVAVIVIVMSGRVIPGFTRANLQRPEIRNSVWIEGALLSTALAMLAIDALLLDPRFAAVAGILGAALAVARSLRWKPWATRGIALLWMLHAAHAWLIVWFALRAGAVLGLAGGESMALHALTVGLVGGLCLAMMMRTARGHSGRAVIASRWDVAAFVALMLAALTRVLAPLMPTQYLTLMMISSAFWALAFGSFAVLYMPMLAFDSRRHRRAPATERPTREA